MSLIKIINLPQIDMEFKMVELYHKGTPILLCGSSEVSSENFHHKILEKYLKENNIDYEVFAPNTSSPMSVIPRPEKISVYKVVGMGYTGIDIPRKYFQPPYGSSRDYNMTTNPEFDQMIIETIEQLFQNKQ